MGAVADYISMGCDTVEGWFEPVDRMMFAVLNSVHAEHGITGDLLEIGAFKGSSAILLGYFAQAGEGLLVCDLFDGEATNPHSAAENEATYPGLVQADFEANYLRFHEALPTIVNRPSAALVEICDRHSFRFMHVDGSHMYPDVMGDLLLTKGLAVGSDAVVAIDDIRSAHTPGVWAAAWECVYRQGLVPFALGTTKMYATWGHPTVDLVGALRERLQDEPGAAVETAPISGGEILRVDVDSTIAHPAQGPSHLGRLALDWMPPKLRRRLL